MQPNILSIDVDPLNNGTIEIDAFSRFEEFQNRSVYVGPGHSLTSKNLLSLYRTLPKVTGNFRGQAKGAVKTTEDTVVLGTDGVSNLTGQIIVETTYSYPVGVSVAALKRARMKHLGVNDDDDVMDPLLLQQMI